MSGPAKTLVQYGYRTGMEKLFRGIMKYKNTFKGNMVKQFIKVNECHDNLSECDFDKNIIIS